MKTVATSASWPIAPIGGSSPATAIPTGDAESVQMVQLSR